MVKSVEVLKGTGAAIYGSRGANGVCPELLSLDVSNGDYFTCLVATINGIPFHS